MKRTLAAATAASFATFPTAFTTTAAPPAQPKRSTSAPATLPPAQTRSAQRSSRRAKNNSLSKNTPQGVFFVFTCENLRFSIPFSRFSLFKRKALQKKWKILAGFIGFSHFCSATKLLAPPRVEILLWAKFTRNRGASARFADFSLFAKWCVPIIKSVRAYSAFADHNKFANRSHASRFRRIFTRYE